MNGKTIVVTGAAGFIGSHLSEYFLNQNARVIGIDNLLTGTRDNLDTFKDNTHFTFLEKDIISPIDIDEPIDFIFNFACPASPIDFKRLRIPITRVNSYGTWNMLELARKHNSVFIFASTSEVYGDPEVNPQQEDYNGNVNTIGIRGVYDEGKRYSESMIMAHHHEYNTKTRIVRIFNTYGEKMRKDDGRIVPTFINQALQNEDITVFGDGNQTRSLQYISDLIDGVEKLALSDVTVPVNIGNPHEMTVNEIAEKIIDLTHSSSKITYHPLPHHDPQKRKPDITRAKELLSWSPHIDLDDGLTRTINWFKENH